VEFAGILAVDRLAGEVTRVQVNGWLIDAENQEAVVKERVL